MGIVKLRGKNATGSTAAADAWPVVSAKTLISTAVQFAYASANAADAYYVSKGNPTMTIASPGVVTLSTHGLVSGDYVKFTTTGALPTGLIAGTQYFVIYVDANSFKLAASYADAINGKNPITTSGSQSGTHTLYAGGTGAREVTVKLIDSTGAYREEAVQLNGTTKVVSAIPLSFRCIGMEITKYGSGGTGAGIIYCADTGDTWTSGVPQTAAKIFGEILAGQTEDQGGHYTVPRGNVGRVKQFIASFPDITATAKYGYCELQYRPPLATSPNYVPGRAWKRYCILGVSSASNMSPFYIEEIPETIPELSDIRIQYRQSAACEVSAIAELEISPK